MNVSCSIQREIRNYIDDLYDRGRRCFIDLEEDEARHLTGLTMKSMKLSDAWEHVVEADSSNDMLLDLINFLASHEYTSLTKLTSRREALLETLTQNAVNYAKNKIDKLLDDKSREMAFSNHPTDFDHWEVA